MVFKCDPPPATNDITVLRNYINELYENIFSVIHNIDADNLTEEFLNSINSNGEGEDE